LPPTPILANHPGLTASRWVKGLPYRDQNDLDALVTPLRLAGLPEEPAVAIGRPYLWLGEMVKS